VRNFQFSTSKIGAALNFLLVVAADATVCVSPAGEKYDVCFKGCYLYGAISAENLFLRTQHLRNKKIGHDAIKCSQ
jgi:hypothetical protein